MYPPLPPASALRPPSALPAPGAPVAMHSTWTTNRVLQDLGCPPPALGLHPEGLSWGASSKEPETERAQPPNPALPPALPAPPPPISPTPSPSGAVWASLLQSIRDPGTSVLEEGKWEQKARWIEVRLHAPPVGLLEPSWPRTREASVWWPLRESPLPWSPLGPRSPVSSSPSSSRGSSWPWSVNRNMWGTMWEPTSTVRPKARRSITRMLSGGCR